MTSRERVLLTIQHKEPDRVPIDLGGMDSTGIMITAYDKLKKYLGVKSDKNFVYDMVQQVVKVEDEVLDKLGCDVKPVLREPKNWKKTVLPDGTICYIPEKWKPKVLDDGSEVILDNKENISLRKPKDCLYFEPVYSPLRNITDIKEIENYIDDIASFDVPFYCDENMDDLEKKAKDIYENTEYAIIGAFASHVFMTAQFLRGWDIFMMDLLDNQKFAEALLNKIVEMQKMQFDKFCKAVKGYVQIINVNDDLGMQDGPQLNPEIYRKIIKPYQKELWQYIKKKSGCYLFLHSCGSVYSFIPDFIEIGVDILNPVQVSAKNMDSKKLKAEFGKYITFWGGGCDTQKVLCFGTPRDVKEEVKKRINDLAGGGGFVFNQVHNIQSNVSPENIMAMYETVHKYGKY
jgi:uroporphyrinogen decarboxylase